MKAILFDLFRTLVDNPTTAQVSSLHVAVGELLGLPAEAFASGWKATFNERMGGEHASTAVSIVAAASWTGMPYNEDGISQAVEVRRELTRV